MEKQFKTNMFCVSLFTKAGYSFRRFNCNRLIQDCWRSYRESTFVCVDITSYLCVVDLVYESSSGLSPSSTTSHVCDHQRRQSPVTLVFINVVNQGSSSIHKNRQSRIIVVFINIVNLNTRNTSSLKPMDYQ